MNYHEAIEGATYAAQKAMQLAEGYQERAKTWAAVSQAFSTLAIALPMPDDMKVVVDPESGRLTVEKFEQMVADGDLILQPDGTVVVRGVQDGHD